MELIKGIDATEVIETAPDDDRTALAVSADRAAALLPVFNGAQMAHALTAYRELQGALDRAMPEQIMNIKGRPFRKKGYWRAIRTAFNLNVACVREEADDYGWRVVYRATTPNGRFADGDGSCEYEEKAEGQDTEHNVRAHAHTRAFNRAVSNLVGFGEVSAEEIGQRGAAPRSAPRASLVKPKDYDEWLIDLASKADEGEAALFTMWGDSSSALRRYLRDTDLTGWEAIKAKAHAQKPKATSSDGAA